MLDTIYPVTQHHIPVDSNHHQHHSKNLRLHNLWVPLNAGNFLTNYRNFGNNLPSFFLWDLSVGTISYEWVISPEQVKSSGRIATISLWTGMLWDDISFIPDKQLHCCELVVTALFVGTGYTRRSWGWLLGMRGSCITHCYPLYTGILKKLQANTQKKLGETIKETSRHVRPEQVNKWPNCMLAWRWWWWWWQLQKYQFLKRLFSMDLAILHPTMTIYQNGSTR
jgi:hypothetical protein